MSTTTRKRVLVTVVVLVAVLVLANIALSSDNGGLIDRWTVKDKSGPSYQPPTGTISLMSYETERRPHHIRHRGRIDRLKKRNTSGHRHRRHGRGGSVWCRNGRVEGTGGNIMFPALVRAGGSQKFCFNTGDNTIVSLGALNSWELVTDSGSYWQWHADSASAVDVIRGEGRACDAFTCWDYEYRRFVFSWHQLIPHIGPFTINKCLSLTMRGTGETVVGKGC